MGIDLVAIGVDTVAGARRSLQNLEPQDRFGFPLLCDRKLRVFREWLAFDDFESMPLHGTFLLDGKGRLVWRDVGHRPFGDPGLVFAEAQRLLPRDR